MHKDRHKHLQILYWQGKVLFIFSAHYALHSSERATLLPWNKEAESQYFSSYTVRFLRGISIYLDDSWSWVCWHSYWSSTNITLQFQGTLLRSSLCLNQFKDWKEFFFSIWVILPPQTPEQFKCTPFSKFQLWIQCFCLLVSFSADGSKHIQVLLYTYYIYTHTYLRICIWNIYNCT